MGIADMTTLNLQPRQRRGRVLMGAAVLALLTGFAGGCSTTGASNVLALSDHDYRARHPILLSEEPEVLDIPVGMNGPAVSAEIETAIRNYVSGYEENGTGLISIQVPTASANQVAAASTGRAVHYALVAAGVPHANIQLAPYYVGDHAKVAVLRLSYLRVKAVTPKCGIWPETTANNYRNTQYQNFGCATQQNLAAMVANPADLIQPQPVGPANGARRADVIKKYATTGNTGWNPVPEPKLINSGDVGGL